MAARCSSNIPACHDGSSGVQVVAAAARLRWACGFYIERKSSRMQHAFNDPCMQSAYQRRGCTAGFVEDAVARHDPLAFQLIGASERLQRAKRAGDTRRIGCREGLTVRSAGEPSRSLARLCKATQTGCQESRESFELSLRDACDETAPRGRIQGSRLTAPPTTAGSDQQAQFGQSLEVPESDRAMNAGNLRSLVDRVSASIGEEREQDRASR
jgi:hypothetical protein